MSEEHLEDEFVERLQMTDGRGPEGYPEIDVRVGEEEKRLHAHFRL